jgi:hypothetical protein
MASSDRADGWARVARETFERSMVPWVGRKHEAWLRAWARPHPVDPGQILVPQRVYEVYQSRRALEPLARWQLDAMGYPKLPPEKQEHRPASPTPAPVPAAAAA